MSSQLKSGIRKSNKKVNVKLLKTEIMKTETNIKELVNNSNQTQQEQTQNINELKNNKMSKVTTNENLVNNGKQTKGKITIFKNPKPTPLTENQKDYIIKEIHKSIIGQDKDGLSYTLIENKRSSGFHIHQLPKTINVKKECYQIDENSTEIETIHLQQLFDYSDKMEWIIGLLQSYFINRINELRWCIKMNYRLFDENFITKKEFENQSDTLISLQDEMFRIQEFSNWFEAYDFERISKMYKIKQEDLTKN